MKKVRIAYGFHCQIHSVFDILRAFGASPSSELLTGTLVFYRTMMQLTDEPLVILDSMAGGGIIPLEAVRYGAKVYANELNPVAT